MRYLLSTFARWRTEYQGPNGRSGELFRSVLHRTHEHTDRLFLALFLVQYPAAIAIALCWSPLTWAGTHSSIHFHVWLAIVFGGLITSLPVYLICRQPGAALTRHVVAVAQALMGSLLIHLTGGRIETHFQIFGSLAFLAFYRDIGVIGTTTAVVVADHLLRGVFFPESIYGVLSVSGWRIAEHAFWVLFEDAFLCLNCVKARRLIGEMAGKQAQLEEVNVHIEEAVLKRTQELSQRTEELAASRDAAMESTRLKSQFLANVSHEIRTPMNGVLGMTTLLLDSDLSPDQRDCAMTVQRSGEALMTIINDILDLSKIEAGKLALERVDFRLCNEVEDVARLLAESAERKGLEFICETDPNFPAVVTGDAGRLRQVLVNLLGNAIKFTDDGEVSLRATLTERDGDNVRARFEVSDTGIGIPEQAQRGLFQAFVQVDGSTTRKHEGTGLGLSISKQIVQLMGGEIGMTSRVGAGSNFWFEIPLEVQAESADAGFESVALRGLRVLIVDDNATNRAVVRRLTTSWGMLPEEAVGGQSALQILHSAHARGESFDIALLDFQMPGMNGVQLARAIRENAQYEHLQLVMLTSLGQRAICKSFEEAGIAACMVKPIRREHLFLTASRLCRERQKLAIDSSPTPQATAAEPKAAAGADGKLSILVAEDNPINQRVVARMLERLGHSYELVTNGLAAVEAVQRSHYDAVVMDMQMPLLDGFEAAVQIRQLPEPAGQIRIIAATANAAPADRNRCLASGMDDFIAKPIRLTELNAVLARITPPERVAA